MTALESRPLLVSADSSDSIRLWDVRKSSQSLMVQYSNEPIGEKYHPISPIYTLNGAESILFTSK